MTDKLDLQSPDLVNQNIEKIAALFPNCVTETENGKAVDFDLLRQELNHDIIEGTKERYRLEWPGKREAIVTANIPTTNTLRPVPNESVDFENTENLYIEGDNLEVLKILQESYLGKIKMIYIDPPYNTGKDFVYKDNFTEDKTEHEKESGQRDELGRRLVSNPESSGRYHSDWLTMMYPRLKLARNLLTDDGVVFISIDDGEFSNIKRQCDEIFGDSNFVATFIWEKRKTRENRRVFSFNHDFILCYSRNKPLFENTRNLLPATEEVINRYLNPDNDSRGAWQSISLNAQAGHATPSQFYDIKTPSGRIVSAPPGRCWSVTQKRFLELVSDDRIWFGKEGGNIPRLKSFQNEVNMGLTPHTLWSAKEVCTNDSAKKSLNALFDGKSVFETPKPTELVLRMIQISTDSSDIILDYFSGSSTTAHAVMQLNSEDGGNRKFIMVQIPEQTDKKSEAYKAGYKNICEIGKERIRRAGAKIKEELEAKQKTESGKLDFNNSEQGTLNTELDTGFRVYKLDSSNMRDVYYRPQEYKQETLDMFADNVKPGRTAIDLVTQVMLDWGLPLSLKIEELKVVGKQVFKVAQNSLLACFDNGIDESFAKEVAKEHPLRIVFRDSSFINDTAKENVKQLLKQLSPETEMRVI